MSVARVELLIELLEVLKDPLHVTRRVDQVGDAEVVSPLLLSETRPWHCHYTCLVHHLHAVDEVRLFALLVTVVDKLLRKMDLREAVHSSFDLCARDLLHIIE